jgi:hypothetical protein
LFVVIGPTVHADCTPYEGFITGQGTSGNTLILKTCRGPRPAPAQIDTGMALGLHALVE